MKKDPMEKEWSSLLKKESVFRKKHEVEKTSFIQSKLEKVVPVGLQETLEKAFYKGFQLIFDNGTGIIEKTYNKAAYESEFQINQFTNSIRKDKKSIQLFRKKAKEKTNLNLLLTGVEGVGLGALGIGLPDIPVFIGVLIKSIHQIALTYGFEYDTREEKQFILELIEISMKYGNEFAELDKKFNQKILSMNNLDRQDDNFDLALERCARTLSNELLYMKFLQGIPIAGIIGGLSNITSLQTVSDYAMLKYQRRFLLRQKDWQ